MPRDEISFYPYFEKEMAAVLQNIDTEGKTVGQFCCNNGRELLSLVKSGKAAQGIGFDIAENQVVFANEKARELNLPCTFEAVNVYDIDERFKDPEGKNMHLEIAYTYDREAAEQFKQEVLASFPNFKDEDVVLNPLSLSVSCHIGPGALAIACSKKIQVL